MRTYTALPLLAALLLAACGDNPEETAQQADQPQTPVAETPSGDTSSDDLASSDDTPVDLTPSQETAQAVENAAEAVAEAAETLTTVAGEQLNELAANPEVRGAVEQLESAAEGIIVQVDQTLSSDAGQAAIGALTSVLGEGAAAIEGAVQTLSDDRVAVAPDVNWQSTFSPEVPFYNLSESGVPAYREPGTDSAVVGTVAPGQGGFIETCNASLDWCLLPFGEEGLRGWVDMSSFGGVAN